MSINYGSGIPKLQQFKSDSSVMAAIRSKDTVLMSIDERLGEYEKYPERQFEILIDLFLSINLWLKSYHEQQPGFLRGRYPAIAELNEAVIRTLMNLTGTPSPGHLMREIQSIIGLNVVDPSKQIDKTARALFYTTAEREKTRIHFKAGTAFRYMMDVNPPRKGLQLLNSRHFENRNIVRMGAHALDGFAPFVMSMERVFYMARHYLPGEGEPGSRFHSTYFGHECRVSAAGTMLIENGEVKAIRNDSGHYQPHERNLAQAIRALQSYGVNLDRLQVYTWSSDMWHADAPKFQGQHFNLDNAPRSTPGARPRAAVVNVIYDSVETTANRPTTVSGQQDHRYAFSPSPTPRRYEYSPSFSPPRTAPVRIIYDTDQDAQAEPISGTRYLHSHI